MPPFSFWGGRRGRGSHQRLLRRLDNASERINPFLMVIAIGLVVLDVSCLIALLDTGSLPIRRSDPGTAVATPATNAIPNQ